MVLKHSINTMLAALLAICAVPVVDASLMTKTVIITIKVPPWTPADSNIYVTGSAPELCNWAPDCLRAQLIVPGIYQAKVELSVAGKL